ncbi:MAG: LDL receptor domain-containing protein [Polyangiales bacterium]
MTKNTALLLASLALFGCQDDEATPRAEPQPEPTARVDGGLLDGGSAPSTDGRRSDATIAVDAGSTRDSGPSAAPLARREVAEKLFTCGVYESLEDADVSSPVRDAYERCLARCFIAAPCEELTSLACDESPAETTLTACTTECPRDPEDGFACKDGSHIPHAYVCDDEDDCDGGEDERDCKHACDDGSPLQRDAQLCDGVRDCADGSDERACEVCEPGRSEKRASE